MPQLYTGAEPDLVQQAQAGDKTAVGTLYEGYVDRVFAYCLARLNNHASAEDVTGQVFLKMVEKIGEFNWQGAGFAAWLFRIAHNCVIDHLRYYARRPITALDDASAVAAAGVDPAQQAEQNEFLRLLRITLPELSELQQQVVLLKYAAELSNGEIALITGRSTNAVNALHYEALKKLARVLGAKGYTF